MPASALLKMVQVDDFHEDKDDDSHQKNEDYGDFQNDKRIMSETKTFDKK